LVPGTPPLPDIERKVGGGSPARRWLRFAGGRAAAVLPAGVGARMTTVVGEGSGGSGCREVA
jgi:hypothetical protein